MIAAAKLLKAVEAQLVAEIALPSLTIGVAEPASAADLPTVAISLQQLVNPCIGLGAHRQIQSGALPARTEMNLDNPVLIDDTRILLLSADRLALTLFHGGLVEEGGSTAPLQASDILVERNGTPFTLVENTPRAGEYRVDAVLGQLVFGEPLPSDGLIQAEYFIGQWERVVYQLQGCLIITSIAASNMEVQTLSDFVFEALVDQDIKGLRELEIVRIGPVTAFHRELPVMRARELQWQFDYECVVDLPDAAGGIIERVKLFSQTDGAEQEQEIILS